MLFGWVNELVAAAAALPKAELPKRLLLPVVDVLLKTLPGWFPLLFPNVLLPKVLPPKTLLPIVLFPIGLLPNKLLPMVLLDPKMLLPPSVFIVPVMLFPIPVFPIMPVLFCMLNRLVEPPIMDAVCCICWSFWNMDGFFIYMILISSLEYRAKSSWLVMQATRDIVFYFVLAAFGFFGGVGWNLFPGFGWLKPALLNDEEPPRVLLFPKVLLVPNGLFRGLLKAFTPVLKGELVLPPPMLPPMLFPMLVANMLPDVLPNVLFIDTFDEVLLPNIFPLVLVPNPMPVPIPVPIPPKPGVFPMPVLFELNIPCWLFVWLLKIF